MTKLLRVLNIEDSETDHELLRRHLAKNGFLLSIERVQTAATMEKALASENWDVILCDYSMPSFSAPEALGLMREMGADIPFIIISGTVGEEEAVKALKAGASDYLIKDNLARLIPAIEREIADAENRHALRRAEEEEKRLDAELLRERERISNIVASVPGVVWEMYGEPNSFPDKLDFISDYVETLLGYSVREWLETPNFWLSIIHPDDFERVRHENEASYSRGDSWRTEFRWLAKDGRVVWVESRSAVIMNGGETVGLRGVTMDISDRKLLEEQLMQAQKLESVGRLAGGIAHDFNNMLTAINGYSELTLRKLTQDHPLRKNIEEIKKAGERSALLTNQLLAFSRRQLLRPEVININSVIAETTKMLQRVIGEDIELIANLLPAVGHVKADPGQLSQIIMNLAVNARDAMPSGGKLTIETGNVFVDSVYAQRHPGMLPGAYIKLSVSDTGTGIRESDRPHIFEPFFTTKEIGKGTGLGLATVYGIVKQSGGSIVVSSELGSGSAFEIYLPRVIKHSLAITKAKSVSHFSDGSETILLVEDEEIVRSLLRHLLEACGYRVIEAVDGPTAMSICNNLTEPLDLLITDVVMPQMGGRELAEKLQQVIPELPVLFTSGYTDDVVVRDGVQGADINFIQKPFTLESVSRKVREILDAAE